METQNPSGGSIAAYDVSYDDAFGLALHACQILNLQVESQNKDQKYIVANNGISAWSWGERIGIYFKEVNPKALPPKNQTV